MMPVVRCQNGVTYHRKCCGCNATAWTSQEVAVILLLSDFSNTLTQILRFWLGTTPTLTTSLLRPRCCLRTRFLPNLSPLRLWLNKKKRASPQTSASTSTKQPDKITAEEPPLTISTLRDELRTLLQTVVQQQIPAVSTPPSLTVPIFTPISTASTTMHVVPANQRTALPSFERNSDVLPPLPENMLLKIQQGKFVNFDLLLPQAFAPSTTDNYVLKVSNEGALGRFS